MVRRTSAVCRAGRERSASRSGSQEVNKRIRIEPTTQGLLTLRNGNRSAQIERIIGEPQREAGLEGISAFALATTDNRVSAPTRMWLQLFTLAKRKIVKAAHRACEWID